MTAPLVLRPLERERVRQAFPLVQSLLPKTSFVRWSTFAHGYLLDENQRPDRGIMAAENQAGYIVGLFTHYTRENLTCGRVLEISSLLVADFPGRTQTVAYLIDKIEIMANLSGCHAIAVELDAWVSENLQYSGWSRSTFARNGYDTSGANQYRKVLEVRRPGLAL